MKGSKLGLGAGAKAGLLGAKGASPSTGPNEGLGMGQRDSGTPEDVDFEKKKLPTNEMNPGQVIGILPSDGESPRGDVRIPVRPVTPADLQRMAEKIEAEVLPAEYREQVYRYMELLRGRGAAPAEEGSGDGAGGESGGDGSSGDPGSKGEGGK